MDEEQRFLRYVFPGLGAVLAAIGAISLVNCRFWMWLSSASTTDWLGVVVGSGGAGFLLAQIYFAFPYARVDHSGWLDRNRQSLDKRRELGDCLGPESRTLSRAQAWRVTHYLWEEYVAHANPALNAAVSRHASRMSAVGTAIVGFLLGFATWIVVLAGAGAPGPAPSACLIALGAALFIIPLIALTVTFCRVERTIRTVVELGLSKYLVVNASGMGRADRHAGRTSGYRLSS
jgi:hypothetical protein